MARKIAMTITDVLKVKKCDPLILSNKYHLDTITERDQFETKNTHKVNTDQESNQSAVNNYNSSNLRASHRHKKPLKSMTNNFLW
jgi:hypothetical protein